MYTHWKSSRALIAVTTAPGGRVYRMGGGGGGGGGHRSTVLAAVKRWMVRWLYSWGTRWLREQEHTSKPSLVCVVLIGKEKGMLRPEVVRVAAQLYRVRLNSSTSTFLQKVDIIRQHLTVLSRSFCIPSSIMRISPLDKLDQHHEVVTDVPLGELK